MMAMRKRITMLLTGTMMVVLKIMVGLEGTACIHNSCRMVRVLRGKDCEVGPAFH